MKRLLIIALCLPGMVFAGGTDWTFGVLGTHGSRSALINPAELAAPCHRSLGIEIPGGGLTASNNSFSVGFWNSHIAGDGYWDRAEVRQILDRIPGAGLNVQADVAVPALGVQWRNFAFNVQAMAATRMNVSKDIAELALVGNRLSEHYSMNDLIGQSLAVSDYSLAYGRVIPQNLLPEITAGAGVHFYQGLAYTDVKNSTAGFEATSEWMRGTGVFQNITATSGQGFGLDLGVGAVIMPKLKAGLTLQRIGGQMSWTIKETQEVRFETNADGLALDSLDENSYTDRVFSHSDTTLKGGHATLRLPMVMRMSALYQINPRWSAAALWNAATGSSPFGASGSEAGVATGYYPWTWLTVEGGILLGGSHRSLFTAGAGLRFKRYELDLGFSSAGGVFGGSRGVGFSLGQRLVF
jgi:hypothetical protein